MKDKWGIPVLHFRWQWSQHETRQAVHMQATFALQGHDPDSEVHYRNIKVRRLP